MNDADRRAYRETLRDDIAGFDMALASERDAAGKLALIEQRRAARDALQRLSAGDSMEYDDLTKMLYEMRSDLHILQMQLGEHLARCQAERSGYSPSWLTVMAVAAVITLVFLVFVVARFLIP